jgi:addiction module HigA family antidote
MNSLRDPARRPTHPGTLLREDVLPALGITQAEFAKHLGLSEDELSELLLEKTAISQQAATAIAVFLKTTADSWLRMQHAVDFWDQQHAA